MALKRMIFAAFLAVMPAAAQTGGVALGAVPPQPLKAGQCGLFLWSRVAAPDLKLVAFDQPAEAVIVVEGKTRTLKRTAFSGEALAGHFEEQTFSDGRITVAARITFDLNRPVQDGAVVREGSLRVTDAAGWEVVSPVGGMSGCQRQTPAAAPPARSRRGDR